jgi:hypothetical protein
MFYALMDGLAGVEDKFKLFRKVKLSPRWLSAEVDQAEVSAQYYASGEILSYEFKFDGEKISLYVSAKNSEVEFNVLLPEKATAKKVKLNKREIDFKNVRVEKSNYANFSGRVKGEAKVEIYLK